MDQNRVRAVLPAHGKTLEISGLFEALQGFAARPLGQIEKRRQNSGRSIPHARCGISVGKDGQKQEAFSVCHFALRYVLE